MSAPVISSSCSVCGVSLPPGKAHCGAVPVQGHALAAPARPKFGQGPRKPLPKVNRVRMASRKAMQFSSCARMARMLPCCACQKRPPSEAAHVVSRGAGGKDEGNVVPLCGPFGCHAQQGSLGIETFQAQYEVDLKLQAARVLNLVRYHDCKDYPEQRKAGDVRCKVCLEPVDTEGLAP